MANNRLASASLRNSAKFPKKIAPSFVSHRVNAHPDIYFRVEYGFHVKMRTRERSANNISSL